MRTAFVLAGTLLVAWSTAQDPVDPEPEQTASAADRLQQLEDLQKKCIADWREAITKAQEAAKNAEPGQAIPAMQMRPDFGPIVSKAKEYAVEFAGTEDAVPFLIFVVQNGSEDKDDVRAAFETLLAAHLDSKKLAAIGGIFQHLDQIVDADFAGKAMERLVKSASANVRGWALLARHKHDIETAERDGEQYGLAKKTLLTAAEVADDKRLAQEVRSAIDLREKFGVGNTAPDIEGVDLDGVAFRLSDYKGKVVFLDFWGDW